MSEEKGIRVTVTDLETGESESKTIKDDYVIITTGTCYVANTQVWSTGTHQLTIKGRTGKRDD